MRVRTIYNLVWIIFFSLFGLAACTQQNSDLGSGRVSDEARLKVVATTTIVGDVVSQVGGDFIDLNVLLPVGADPHSFDPTPQDIAKVADAELVFANGLGLEAFLDPLIESAGAEDKVIHISEGGELLLFNGEADHEHQEEEHQGADPHTWTDPNNVIIWVDKIAQALSEADPDNASAFADKAKAYKSELENLDDWIRSQVAQIPTENRKLVTDHTLFSYFADEYGFEQVGALIPGYSTLAEPTAQELAKMEDAIRQLGVQAIFVGNTVNPALAERVSQDTGTILVFVYTGSLSEPEGDAPTFLDYMNYNTRAFVDALK